MVPFSFLRNEELNCLYKLGNWKEVSDADFVNNEPENEYDIKVIRWTYNLLKEAVEVLNGPVPLSPERRTELTTQIGKLREKLREWSILVNRVDPRVTVYQRGST